MDKLLNSTGSVANRRRDAGNGRQSRGYRPVHDNTNPTPARSPGLNKGTTFVPSWAGVGAADSCPSSLGGIVTNRNDQKNVDRREFARWLHPTDEALTDAAFPRWLTDAIADGEEEPSYEPDLGELEADREEQIVLDTLERGR